MRMAASEKRMLIVERRNTRMKCPHFRETCFGTMLEDSLVTEIVFRHESLSIDTTGIMKEAKEVGNSKVVEKW